MAASRRRAETTARIYTVRLAHRLRKARALTTRGEPRASARFEERRPLKVGFAEVRTLELGTPEISPLKAPLSEARHPARSVVRGTASPKDRYGCLDVGTYIGRRAVISGGSVLLQAGLTLLMLARCPGLGSLMSCRVRPRAARRR